MDKVSLKKNIENLNKKDMLIFKNIMDILGDYSNLTFLYGINLKYKNNEIVKNALTKMKESYNNIKEISIKEYKRILLAIFLSDKKVNTLLEAIEFIKNN